jgi:hypothetical protein
MLRRRKVPHSLDEPLEGAATGQADLQLAPEVATQWRERLSVTTDGQACREIHSILFDVRGRYRDLA